MTTDITETRSPQQIALDAIDEIALAGMSGSGQESEEGMRDWHARRAWDFIAIAARARTAISAAAPSAPFQQRVDPWLVACFGEAIARDKQERNHRFLEESLELAQACQCTKSEAHQLVDYVFSRAVGERSQEVGGVMVTLAALCLANGLDMDGAGETELQRIWTKVETIRAKQKAKPKHSPLPVAPPAELIRVDLVRNLQTWLVCRTLGTALQPELQTVQRWVAALGVITGEVPTGWTVDGPAVEKQFDEAIGLREMAKHAHRALNAAANALASVEDDIAGDETVEQLRARCASIACSLFSLLREPELDRFLSEPPAASTSGSTDAAPNAGWLTLAHNLCMDWAITSGQLSERLEALRIKLGRPEQALEHQRDTERLDFLEAHPLALSYGQFGDWLTPGGFEWSTAREAIDIMLEDLKRGHERQAQGQPDATAAKSEASGG